MALIEVHDLVKHYRNVRAVDGVSIAIGGGVCFGLLGPNGAGKTTTVEMLEGLTEPTAGTILYKGEPLGLTFRQEAGIMFQHTALQDFVTVQEALHLFSSFYKRTASVQEIIEWCALGEFLDRDTRKLSGGQRQRVLLAIALINDPQVVFLDEPTTGLDPQARRNFWSLIKTIKGRGKTVVLTTHYMEEAYELCDEIAIMDRGKIIARGTPNDLLAQHFNDVILQLPKRDYMLPPGALPVPVLDCGEVVEIHTADVNGAIKSLLANEVPLAGLQIRGRTLDDLFLELTGKELRA